MPKKSLLERVGDRLGFVLKQMGLAFPGAPPGYVAPAPYAVYPGHGPWWNPWHRNRYDANSIVQAVVGWVGRTFPEAPLRVWNRTPNGDEVIFDHPLELLVEHPNEYYAGPLLWTATLADYFLEGNAYWLKVRDGRRRVVELWWLPSMFIEPKWESDESYIDYYVYRPKGEEIRIEEDDIVHFRYGLDADNPRKGKSPFAHVLSEVLTDNEATLYTQTVLKNLGVPGVIMSPSEEQLLSDDELEMMKRKFAERFTGTHRGEPLILTSPTKVDILSFSPDQMNLRDLRKIPEERITAVVGLPAMVAGMGAGLDRSTFSNYGEAREAAYESLIIPMQRSIAADVQTQLLDDFAPVGPSIRGSRARQKCAFDISAVRVLQTDQDKLMARLVAGVEGGILTPNEARSKIGFPEAPDEQADLRLIKVNLMPLSATSQDGSVDTSGTAPGTSADGALPGGEGNGSPAGATPRGTGAIPAGEPIPQEVIKALPSNFARWMNGTSTGRED